MEIVPHERRDVAMVDILGDFLTLYMDKEVIMVIRVRLLELMLNTETSIYHYFVTIDNRWMVIYVKLQKALYGCLRSVLLFYEKLVSEPKLKRVKY